MGASNAARGAGPKHAAAHVTLHDDRHVYDVCTLQCYRVSKSVLDAADTVNAPASVRMRYDLRQPLCMTQKGTPYAPI